MLNKELFHVYAHYRKDSNTLFYIGKGRNTRVNKKDGRNQYWKNIVNKHGFYSEILYTFDNEEQAFKKEKELIELYAEFICNLTQGGEGVSGYKHTESAIIKMKINKQGYKVKKETKEKLSKFYSGKQPKRKQNLLGFRGVSKHGNSFVARITYNKHTFNYYGFSTSLEAAKHYDLVAKEFYKNKAILNFPEITN